MEPASRSDGETSPSGREDEGAPGLPGLAAAVRRLEEQAGDAAAPDPEPLCPDPVFLLSAGWRSGSTLLQRLIMSDRRSLIWGEPFGDHLPITRLAQMIEPFAQPSAHPRHALARFEGDLTRGWIANLNPGVAALRRAHRAWWETLFAAPARERGYARWGCKWVRLSAHHGHYLRWLYPACRLVFLVRHPLHALRSYQGQGETWYLARPDLPVRSPREFLAHWGALADSFLSQREDLGALLLRYEDVLAGRQSLQRLSRHLGSDLDERLLATSVGASTGAAEGRLPAFPRLQQWRLRRTLERLGYAAGGAVRPQPCEVLE